MILLDTNVLSELMKPAPSEQVVNWISSRPATSLFVTVLTQAELLYGVELLAEGRRKTALRNAVDAMFKQDFAERILNFDTAAAVEFADIAAKRDKVGKPISQIDAQIAAIARSRGAKIATRNVKDFEHCGVEIINPWAN